MTDPLVSCLCVTEGRPRAAFWPWFLWGYSRQDYRRTELVVVSPDDVPPVPWGSIRVVRCDPASNVAARRNLALGAARGDLVSWFDDDDWQHPSRLSTMVAALEARPGVAAAGPRRSWFVNVDTGRAAAFSLQVRTVLFNGLVARRRACPTFDETLPRAADTPWTDQLAGTVSVDAVASIWLCHGRNVSNPASARTFPLPLSAVAAEVGPEAWADTDRRLAALRRRLGRDETRAPHTRVSS